MRVTKPPNHAAITRRWIAVTGVASHESSPAPAWPSMATDAASAAAPLTNIAVPGRSSSVGISVERLMIRRITVAVASNTTMRAMSTTPVRP